MQLAESALAAPRIAAVVEDGYVEEIRDGANGFVYISAEFLKQEELALTRLRAEAEDLIHRGEPRFQCAHCGIAVRLRLSPKKNWYFRHVEDDGSCRYQSQGVFSQAEFDARRYNGQKEGPQHRAMKRRILESLRADSSFDSASIHEEVRWNGKHRPNTWRKPDVQAKRHGMRFAFEVQLSSTYINVMRERRRFYLEEGGLLFWILTGVTEKERRQFENDVLYPNNCNIFALDDETSALSKATASLQLRCGYLRPIREGWRIMEQWVEAIVPLADLKIDVAAQRVFLFDYDHARSVLQDEVRTIDGINVLDVFRDELLRSSSAERERTWRDLKKRLPRELMWPKDDRGHDFFKVVALYLSAREGRPIGWEYGKLIQVAHWCADSAPYLLPFCVDCFEVFGRGDILAGKAYGKKWAAKLEAVAVRDFEYQKQKYLHPLARYREALRWLLPEVQSGLNRTFASIAQ